jgi:hypothetical protein
MSKSPYEIEVKRHLVEFKKGRDMAKAELAKSGLTHREKTQWERHLDLMERSIAEAEEMLTSVL